jgi:hypothetical protein
MILPGEAREPVTIFPRLASGYGPGIAIQQARKWPTMSSVSQGRAALTEDRVKWGLYLASFSEPYVPRPGDRIQDQNGVNFVILPSDEMEKGKMGQLFNCETRKEL